MLQRLMAVGPIWTLVQCSGQGVIKEQPCGYSDELGSKGCTDHSFGHKMARKL